jgi:hypothetical protein
MKFPHSMPRPELRRFWLGLDSQARFARLVDFSRPMEWGADLLAGSCNASLNGGNVTGDVVVGDLLSCANAGELRVSTSPDLGGKLLYRIVFS